MKKIKQVAILCLVMLMVITSVPLNALANEEEGTLKTSQTEVITDEEKEEEIVEDKGEREEIIEEQNEDHETVIETENEEKEEEKEVEDGEKEKEEDKSETEDKKDDELLIDTGDVKEELEDDENETLEIDDDEEENDKIEGSDEEKEDILNSDKEDSLIDKLAENFNTEEGFLKSIKRIFLKDGLKNQNGLVLIKVVDKDDQMLGLQGAKIEIIDKSTNKIVKSMKTDRNGLIKVRLDKGEYSIKQIMNPDGYRGFIGSIDFKVESFEWAKLIKIDNIKRGTEILKYHFKAVDQANGRPIKGVKIRVTDKNDPTLWIEETTDENGLITLEYLKASQTIIQYFNDKSDYKVEIVDSTMDYPIDAEVEYTVEDFTFNNGDSNVPITDINQRVEIKKAKKVTFVIYNYKNKNTPIKGSKFKVYDKNGKLIKFNFSNYEKDILTTGQTGEINENVKLPKGIYYIEQVHAGEGAVKKEGKIKVDFNGSIIRIENASAIELNLRGDLRIAVDKSNNTFYHYQGDYKELMSMGIDEMKKHLVKVIPDEREIPYEGFRINKFPDKSTVKLKGISLTNGQGEPIKHYVFEFENNEKLVKIYSQIRRRKKGDGLNRKRNLYFVNKKITLDYKKSINGGEIFTNKFRTDIEIIGGKHGLFGIGGGLPEICSKGIDLRDNVDGENINVYEDTLEKIIRYQNRLRQELKSHTTISNYGLNMEGVDVRRSGSVGYCGLKTTYYSEIKPREESEVVRVSSNTIVKADCLFVSDELPAFYLPYMTEYKIEDDFLNIKLTKYEGLDGVNTKKTLEGVEFTLFNRDESSIRGVQLTNDKGVAVFTELNDGKYILRETGALPGYEESPNKYFIEIANGSVVSMETMDKDEKIDANKKNIKRSLSKRSRSKKTLKEGELDDNNIIEKVIEANMKPFLPTEKTAGGYPILRQMPMNTIEFALKLKLKDTVKEGDYFKICFGDNMRPGALTYPYKTQNPMIEGTMLELAKAEYDEEKNETKYTITKEAAKYINKEFSIHIESLRPMTKYGSDNDGNLTTPNSINRYNVMLKVGNNNGHERHVFTSVGEDYYIDFGTTLSKLMSELDEDEKKYEANFFRTEFERTTVHEDGNTVTTVSYVNMCPEEHIPNFRGESTFRIANRFPNQKGKPVFSNIHDVKVYRIPYEKIERFMPLGFGDFSRTKNSEQFRVTNKDVNGVSWTIKNDASFHDDVDGRIDDYNKDLQLLSINFKEESFRSYGKNGSQLRDGYIIVNKFKREKENDGGRIIFSNWNKSGLFRGIALSQVGESVDSTARGLKNIELTFINEKNKAEIKFDKADADNTNIKLDNVEFELFKKNKGQQFVTTGEKETSKNGGKFGFSGLGEGEYQVREIKPLEGYELKNDVVCEFKVNKDGKVIIKDKEITEPILITNSKKGVKLKIKKIGEKNSAGDQNGLNNVEFKLSGDLPGGFKTDYITKTVDGEKGIIEIENIKPGTYIFTEVKPAQGYSPRIIRIVVDEEYNVNSEYVVFENGKYIKDESVDMKTKNPKGLAALRTSKMTKDANNKIELESVQLESGNTIRPNIGEYIALKMNMNIKRAMKKGDIFTVKMSKALTPIGPVTAPNIKLKNKGGDVIAESEFIEGDGYINTYEFTMLQDQNVGAVSASGKLFINRTRVGLNGDIVIPIFINNQNKKNINVRVDYGDFLRVNKGYNKQFFINKLNTKDNTFEGELYFTLSNDKEKNKEHAYLTKKILITDEVLVNNAVFDSLYGVIGRGEKRKYGITERDRNEKPIEQDKLMLKHSWGESNPYNKPIGLKIQGKLDNKKFKIRRFNITDEFDLSHLYELKDEESNGTEKILVKFEKSKPNNFGQYEQLMESVIIETDENGNYDILEQLKRRNIEFRKIESGEEIWEYADKSYLLPLKGKLSKGDGRTRMTILLYVESDNSNPDPDPDPEPTPDPDPEPVYPDIETITILNEYNEIDFNKTDEAGEVLEGAKFVIRKKGNADNIKTTTSTDTGKVHFENIAPGEYELYEISAPEGYIQKTGVLAEFTVEENGEIKITSKNGITDGDIVNIEFEIPETGIDTIIPFMGLGIIFIFMSGSIFLKKNNFKKR